jgi:alkanesulfonate monooxygenase SsuD/methylene tetrahydromethanopterin reductase-like flavin-dependent oxidoreductase (luciferase family)
VSSPSLARLGAVHGAFSPPEELSGYARAVEALGFGHLWVVEDCFLAGGLALASSALAVTERLRVGVGLMPAPLRNPALAAMEIATLARVHPGRFTATFGHGVRSWMDQVGALPGKRLAALEETVAVVRALVAGESVTLEGSYLTIRDVELEMPPSVVPDILIGSTGPRGIALARDIADGLLLPEGCGPDFVRWAGGEGGDAPKLVVYAWLAIDEKRSEAIARVAPAVERWAASEHYPWPRELAGLGQAPAQVPDAEISPLAARVSVAGTAHDCALSLQGLFDAGADRVILVPQGPDALRELAQVASEVAPALSL